MTLNAVVPCHGLQLFARYNDDEVSKFLHNLDQLGPSKLVTTIQLTVFAGRHGMVRCIGI